MCGFYKIEIAQTAHRQSSSVIEFDAVQSARRNKREKAQAKTGRTSTINL